MPEKIILYKDQDYTLPLSTGTWSQTIEFGEVDIPAEGYIITPPTPCFGRNEGDTTMINLSVKPIVSPLGIGGNELVNDLSIAPDVTGLPGNFGNDGQEVVIISGQLSPIQKVPISNTTNNLPNPTALPVLSAGFVSSNLVAGIYTVAYSFKDAIGETLVSPTTNFTISNGGSIIVDLISLPAGANSVIYYLSYKAGSLVLYLSGKSSGSATTLTSPHGFFKIWIRQKVTSTNTPGKKQAQILISATDIG